ncbi:MAG: NTP transferase domain-containing protein, partial [Patulibacter sp.]
GEPLVARAVRAAAGGLPRGSEIVVVVGAHEQAVRGALPQEIEHRVVVAERWADGLGASLRAGLAACSQTRVMVLLADQPRVDAALVAQVAAEGMGQLDAGAAAVRPVAAGVPGHPVLLGPIALTRAADLTGDHGLAPLLRDLHVHAIALSDASPLLDIDRPSDLLLATSGSPAPAPVSAPAKAPRRHGGGGTPRPVRRAARTPQITATDLARQTGMVGAAAGPGEPAAVALPPWT